MNRSRVPRRVVFVMGTFLISVLLYVDRACISAAKDSVTGGLGLDDKQWGWVLAAFAFGYALFQVPGGALADRFGPRALLTIVVSAWSLFTGLTGAAWNYVSLLVCRFLFGAGEAGAFPAMARAAYSWIPMRERGVVQGINFSGSRIGGALAMPLVAMMIKALEWRLSFAILAAVGLAFAIVWHRWFRDEPADLPGMSEEELTYILETRQKASPEREATARLSAGILLGSKNMWLAMVQYIASNFTFYFALMWAFPYLKQRYDLDMLWAGCATAVPLLCGALGNWVSGAMVDWVYRRGHWKISRRLPAMVGFALAAAGMMALGNVDNVYTGVLFLSIAVFGADMTLSPSWSFCVDIGRKNAGAVSGTMNMAGNFSACFTLLAFPYMSDWTGSEVRYFMVAAGLNIFAIVVWMYMRPDKVLEEY